MKKIYFVLAVVLLLAGCSTSAPETGTGTAPDSADTSKTIAEQTKPDINNDTVVGIAWRADEDSEFYTNVCRAVEEAGGTWVKLEQVKSADMNYDDNGKLTAGVAETGALDEESGKLIRTNAWNDSNAEEAVKDVDIVLFTGGEDISPTLYLVPEEWHGIEEEKDYNAERDVSDYLTMSYCLDEDIPVLGFCRGMQMLSVISGGEVIQDIPTYFSEQGVEYDYQHRNQKETPDSYRDYAPHEVVVENDSILYDMVGTELLTGCPSWHHQAVKSVDNTPLAVTGYTDTNGIKMIEAVERTDKTFAVGLQFHPEAAVVKNIDNAENRADFLDYDTALNVFKYIVQGISEELENAA
ncbi:MAG: gamma-glutamyl-gamma-aminobutyrate hydrolase family protein [Firmicutes bacterium]|nr:gamma-glutamyl-gamma-aminobutyrate hydrolase family protein [Bacillota bacterium]